MDQHDESILDKVAIGWIVLTSFVGGWLVVCFVRRVFFLYVLDRYPERVPWWSIWDMMAGIVTFYVLTRYLERK